MSVRERILRWLAGPCFAALVIALAGCPGAQVPSLDLRDPVTMRAVLALQAQAVLDANKVCADVTRTYSVASEQVADLAGVKLAAETNLACTEVTENVHAELLVAQSMLDAYEDGMQGRIGCAAGAGVDGLRRLTDIIMRIDPHALSPSSKQAIAAGLALMSIAPATCPLPRAGDAGTGG